MTVKKKSKKTNPANKAYLTEHRWTKNKEKSITSHRSEHPNDKQKVGTIPDYTRKKSEGYSFGTKSNKKT